MGRIRLSEKNVIYVINCMEDGYKALGLAILRCAYLDLKKGNSRENRGNYVSAKRFLKTRLGRGLVEYFDAEWIFELF